ncbi:hypothetical protein ACQUQU_14090 [Thalassolituus sp. LLYu03]|uniref:hypothetical protein n=1 Tax=Thalassolituus sp. LLYu03 TaxID=3421656 RepID=UPI003D26C5AB
MSRFQYCVVILLTVIVWPALADEADARAHADDQNRVQREGNSEWVEETLVPRTEWVERLMTPFNRWVEKRIQGDGRERRSAPGPAADFSAGQPPANAISPQEAVRLAQLLLTGQVLLVRYYPEPIPLYAVRILGRKGNVANFYINAIDGTLVDAPAAAAEGERP